MTLLFSADSHVVEPADLWKHHLGQALLDELPPMPSKGFDRHPGGTNPSERAAAMAADGVCGEILYPSLALHLFATKQPIAQQAAFRVYNDWIADYRQVAVDKLFGIGCLSVYDIGAAIAEIERCRDIGLHGVMVWQSPHPSIPFYSPHYEPLWAAAAATGMPISFHALTGFHASSPIPELPEWDPLLRRCVANKLASAVDLLYTLIFHGILQRHPSLRIVLAENDISWIPWILKRWDHYRHRFEERLPFPARINPSTLFAKQVFCTFMATDQDCMALRDGWGWYNCLWANDFPHGDSTWPESRRHIEQELSAIPQEASSRILSENALELYGLDCPSLP